MKELISNVISVLQKNNLTLATAESCTGGLIAKSITDVSGASSIFMGGVVSYANEVKMGVLGVSEDTLKKHGAVSHETAEEMALGACRACFSSVSVSTTGIAGPLGGTPQKPVGTVYVGLCINGDVKSRLLSLSPSLSRDEIRNQAVRYALEMLLGEINQRY